METRDRAAARFPGIPSSHSGPDVHAVEEASSSAAAFEESSNVERVKSRGIVVTVRTCVRTTIADVVKKAGQPSDF